MPLCQSPCSLRPLRALLLSLAGAFALTAAGCTAQAFDPPVVARAHAAPGHAKLLAENPRTAPEPAAPAAGPAARAANASPATAAAATGEPADDAPVDDSEPTLFRQLDETFGRRGEVKDGVYRLVTPRPDLLVTVDGMDVPTGAFIESDFRFWRCPCGKLLVNGQFVLADYEANDVVDELQTGKLHVASIAPVLLHEQPRLLMVRFQGEGRAFELAKALRSALSYTGEERNAPQPANLSPPQE